MGKEYATTLDSREIQAFEALAGQWWEPEGAFRLLHLLNPARLEFVWQQIYKTYGVSTNSLRPYTGLTILDVGCGGGILSEPLARCGAVVTGIDGSDKAIVAARNHAELQKLTITYQTATVEECAKRKKRYDVVIAMEVIEHVTDVDAFMSGLSKLAKPEGLVILSTLNRTLKSYGVAILGAEWVLRLLPKGTHEWQRFLTPSELSRHCRHAHLKVEDIQGMSFHPWCREFSLGKDLSVNYLLSARK